MYARGYLTGAGEGRKQAAMEKEEEGIHSDRREGEH